MGIVHRDIKPSNLLINAEGRLWVADFGLATTLTDSGLTITGDLLGTLRYMSPEQISGLRSFVDQRTDVYSLGITLYELLALAPAFSATERAELIRQVKEDDPSPGPLRQRGVPRELEVVVFKAASKDVSTRYATAQALADDLQRYLDDRPILARRPSPFEQFRKWSRRHQTLTRSLILAAIVSVCSMAAATGLILHERQKAELERLARQAESAVAEAERKNLRQQQYVNEINLAENAVRRNDMTEAARYLNESVPAEGDQNLRGFEWRYLSALSRCAVLEIGRHQGAAYTVMPSPTEDVFASCGQDGIRIWDRRTNSLLKTLTAHANEVNTVNFSPDGRQMISTGDDFEGLVWETHTWSILARLPHTGQAFGGGFTSDGRLLLTGERQEDIMGIPTGENVVRVWNAKTWEQVAVLGGHNNRLTAGDLSDDGKIAMTGDRDGRVKIWKMPEGKLQREFQHFEAGPSKSLMRIVESIDLAHRHPWFVTAGLFSIVEVGNINDGSPIAQVQTHGTIRSARFSPDDSYLVITGDINGIFGTVRVWEITATGDFKEISALTFPKVIWSLVFLNDDEVVFSSGDGAVYRWRLPYRLLERRLRSETPDTTSSAAVSPDGRWLARTGDRLEVQPFDDPSQSIVLDPEAADSTVAFSPDGRLLVRERGGACTFWSTETWRFAFSTDPRAGVDFTEPRKRLQFIDGGRRMQADWVGGGKGVWDLPPSVWPRQFAGDPVTDSELPASFRWAEKDAPGIYEMHHGGRILWRFKIPHVRTFEVSPDGLLFAAGLTDGRIDLYDAASGAIATSCVGTGEPVVGMMFSPSCRTLASSGESGNQITLWHVPTGRRLITINPRLSRIQSFFFTPDEDSLVAAGQNVAGHGEVVIFSTRPAQ
jgi:WD40 repeat protein